MELNKNNMGYLKSLNIGAREEKLEGAVFKVKLSEPTIGNIIQFSSKSRIVSASIKYKDNFNHEIINITKNIVQNGSAVALYFDYFYINEYELEINGYDIYNYGIEDLSIVEVDETAFKESKDSPHGHLLDLKKMAATSSHPHEGNNVLSNGLNDDLFSHFQSTDYSASGAGEIIINTGVLCLVDEIKLCSTFNHAGYNNNFTISYRSNPTVAWKEIIRTENNKELINNYIFKPVLASEFLIRITKSTDNKMFLADTTIVKHSTIRREILDLFTSSSLSRLAQNTTHEMINLLKERATFTEDYMRMLERASDLLIDRELIPAKVLKLNLKELTLIKEVAFTNNREILRGSIKYRDIAGNVCVKRLYWYPEDVTNGVVRIGTDNPIVGKLRILSDDVEILIYGADDVEFVDYKSLSFDSAFLKEEKNTELLVNKCFLDGTFVEPLLVLYEDTPIYGWCDPCYPGGAPRPIIDPLENNLLRLGDKNEDIYYRTLNFKPAGYADIDIYLGKEMFVGEVDIKSYFENGVGEVNKFEILAEDIAAARLSWDENTHEKQWVSIGSGERKSRADEYMVTKLKPYYTDKIKIRIHDAKDYKARINEIRVYQYSTLDTEVDAIFSNETYTSLKNGVTIETIRELESRALENGRFTERLSIAKKILSGEPIKFEVAIDKVKIFNKIQISSDVIPTKVEIKYTDSTGKVIGKVCEQTLEYFKNDSFTVLNLPILCARKLEVIVYGVNSIDNIFVNELNFKSFIGENSLDSKIDLNKTVLTSTHGKFNNLENLKDSSMTSYYTSDFFTNSGYTDIKIKLNQNFIVDGVKLLSFRSKTSGLVRQFKLLAKEPLTGIYVELGDSGYSTSYKNSHREIKGVAPYLTDEVIVRVTSAEGDWAIVNDIEIQKLTK